ncbi:precorrin-3B C(17)-methyltransferase [Ferrovibrio terrae]|uniref:Precorrin-3B C(17)-methyltransferase n=1 Tax=Ferrovibrio terrae TaxID=2594003 RepID=A0A516H060_9PROT|nr:precorrin-3B C(17)-methyltransferase [Ferrovibrio terrae]QDO97164.1 precorrin-3B C(17)-methyltransferase [Ferrovibrio terrae]
MSGKPALVLLTPHARNAAQALMTAFPAWEVYAPDEAALQHALPLGKVTETIAQLFQSGRPVIGICAAGILIRAVAPHLADKQTEPPLIAVASDGSSVVPLLGGHHGANLLSRRIATVLQGIPAITTAGDLAFGLGLDEPPDGYTLANPQDAKGVMATLLRGGGIRIKGNAPWLAGSNLPIRNDDGALLIEVTHRSEDGSPEHLVYHPRSIAIGVGCERNTKPVELIRLVQGVIDAEGIARDSISGIYSLDLKADEPAMQELAKWFGVPFRVFDAATLDSETPRMQTPSDVVFAEVGTHGVAEGAALAAAGPEAELIVPKRKSDHATCAFALAPAPFDGATRGNPRGELHVVGTGPGDAMWLTPEARIALAEATDWVGYGLYLDLYPQLQAGKVLHRYELGEEEVRVRAALDLAATGKRVALVCSGDPGIYAMATLVFALLEKEPERKDWARVAVQIAPGISALQAAAARSGALLGHDFCTISLSDLLTPLEAILERIKAAAEADFVIAFYNPVSQRRRHQLEMAKDILLQHRPAETPVVLARNLGREGERVTLTTLNELDIDKVDMLTVVLVGSSVSRAIELPDGRRFAYTPRGYEKKFTE